MWRWRFSIRDRATLTAIAAGTGRDHRVAPEVPPCTAPCPLRPPPARVVYRGGPRDGREAVVEVPGGVPTTEIVPEDPLGYYGRTDRLDDGRWVMVWRGPQDESAPTPG
jgi:hypothetical protein